MNKAQAVKNRATDFKEKAQTLKNKDTDFKE
jgi:hypothetical protein